MDLQNEISINNVPAALSVNFDQLRQALEADLERYRIVVTADTVKDAKKLATELNATKKLIDDRRKEEVAKASEPIRQFDEQMKELVLTCVKGRQDILDQVKRFENETLELCREKLIERRDTLFYHHSIEPEFQDAGIEDLVKLTSLTAKNNLTASACSEMERRALECKSLQDRTERRLLELENQSYKAGLAAPLQRQHVESFLFAPDDDYRQRLDQLMVVEVQRQEEAENRMRSQMEKEQARQKPQDAPAPEPAPEPEPEAAKAPEPPPAPKEKAAPGKVAVTVTAQFHLEIGSHVSDAAIDAELRRVMTKAGITTLSSVDIHRHQQQAA